MAILDADKEGFLRSHRALTQTAGRAARNVNGKVIMYGDNITDSMRRTIDETNRRREKQLRFNQENGITPRQIKKERKMGELIKQTGEATRNTPYESMETRTPIAADPIIEIMNASQLEKSIERTRKLMEKAAKELNFIEAAQYRDEMLKMQEVLDAKRRD